MMDPKAIPESAPHESPSTSSQFNPEGDAVGLDIFNPLHKRCNCYENKLNNPPLKKQCNRSPIRVCRLETFKRHRVHEGVGFVSVGGRAPSPTPSTFNSFHLITANSTGSPHPFPNSGSCCSTKKICAKLSRGLFQVLPPSSSRFIALCSLHSRSGSTPGTAFEFQLSNGSFLAVSNQFQRQIFRVYKTLLEEFNRE